MGGWGPRLLPAGEGPGAHGLCARIQSHFLQLERADASLAPRAGLRGQEGQTGWGRVPRGQPDP